MQFLQHWKACAIDNGQRSDWFEATVPGNVQKDYGVYKGFGDVSVGMNADLYKPTEDYTWEYTANLDFVPEEGKRLFFVSKGIDYQFDILLKDKLLLSHEGMFSRIELDLTGLASPGDPLCVRIHPHPKRAGAAPNRTQANYCVKAPVCYKWDWHPRLLVSGIWDDTYLESRGKAYIRRCEPFYTLNADRTAADIRFETECDAPVDISLFDAEGNKVGTGAQIHLDNPNLWWCNGQGDSYLYHWTADTAEDHKEGYIGLRTLRLIMNGGAFDEPKSFPKTRYPVPAQFELNGRPVFAKGSNWVSPDIFEGEVTADVYEQHVRLAKEANMNIFRCWGGSGVYKDAFYESCDRMGIMLWVEFPLACNDYPDDDHYLTILEQEATAIVKRLRSHASVALWCGGNELFNNWSGMNDQSLPLRLLNRVCYELDRNRPFNMTSPLFGMAHGGYTFYDPEARCDCFTLFQHCHNTTYTEFGVPGMPDVDVLRSVIPEEEQFPIRKTPAWVLHHAFKAWGEDRWLCLPDLERYAGPLDSLEKTVEVSQWTQCEGYKAIFEEARRQQPYCGMVINWCYDEPWVCSVNNSLIGYPIRPKKAYYAVQSALRPVLFSARIPHFDWNAGDTFSAEIWLLNDTVEKAGGKVDVWLELDGKRFDLIDWSAEAVDNLLGPTVHFRLPDVMASSFTLHLDADGFSSSYKLCYRPSRALIESLQKNA